MVASLQDDAGRVTVDGFYDNVLELTAQEREKYGEAPFDEAAYMKDLGVTALGGEKKYTPVERGSIRPTLDLNGIWGGYTGEGTKTVLPSEAYAKISMRLVGDQTPGEINEKFTKYFKSIAPEGVTVEVESLQQGYSYFTTTETLLYKAGEIALTESFGVKPFCRNKRR